MIFSLFHSPGSFRLGFSRSYAQSQLRRTLENIKNINGNIVNFGGCRVAFFVVLNCDMKLNSFAADQIGDFVFVAEFFFDDRNFLLRFQQNGRIGFDGSRICADETTEKIQIAISV